MGSLHNWIALYPKLENLVVDFRSPNKIELIPNSLGNSPGIKQISLKNNNIINIPDSFYEKYNIVKSTPFYLEFMTKSVSKGNAIIHLVNKLGLDMSQTMAIGDAENDRAMLEVVANPVVMENGVPELKKIAKHITKSNNESGVAHAIREWVLN